MSEHEFVPLHLLEGLQLPSDMNPLILVVDPSAMKDEAPVGVENVNVLHQIKFSTEYAAMADLTRRVGDSAYNDALLLIDPRPAIKAALQRTLMLRKLRVRDDFEDGGGI